MADQIYSSMCVLYDAKDESEDVEENEQENEMSQTSEVLEKKEEILPEPQNETTVAQDAAKKYKAALAGFSSLTANGI